MGYGIAVQDSDPVTEARAETAPTPRLRTRTRASRSSGVWLGLGFALIASLVQGVALLVPWGELPGLGAEVGLALAGFGLLQFLIVLALTTFLRTFGQPRLRLLRTQVGVLATMLLVAVVARGLLVAFEPSPLWLPVALAPLWTAVNFDRRAGFVVAVSMALVLASLVGFDSVVLCVLLARGMSATLTFLGRRSASGVLLAGVRAGGTAGLVLVAVYALGGRPQIGRAHV